MKSLIIYFSWTGCVATLTEHLRSKLEPFGEVTTARIAPARERTYWSWLLRSFLPRGTVPILPVVTDLREFEVVCLAFPKWTLGCPPLNQCIRVIQFERANRVGLLMCYGGFDQKRYMRSMVRRLARRGARVAAVASIRRSSVRDGSYEDAIGRFSRELLSSISLSTRTTDTGIGGDGG